MKNLATVQSASNSAEEDRILRRWTPILLRSIVVAAMCALFTGLTLSVGSPARFVDRYRQVQLGHLVGRESLAAIAAGLLAGDAHAMLTVGLYLLTLVPLVRVAFCLGLFVKSRDYAYVVFTAYVLVALILGAMIGRIG